MLGARCHLDEPLSRRSSLRVGGPALCWLEPHTEQELAEIIGLCERDGLSWFIAGLGSNTLFPDEGIQGAMVRLGGELAGWRLLGEESDTKAQVEVGAGCVNAHLVRAALKAGLVGAEFLMLIPGLFGGAVAMNAGTKEAELGAILRHVELLDATRLERVELDAPALAMRYRHAEIPAGHIVLRGLIELERGDVERARARALEDKSRRSQTQPYKLASLGSTFANPPGDHAGRLIEAAGLKGERCGGARISPMHANFFINEQGATAEDFLRLMARARVRVRRDFGVELRPEVRFVGFDGWSRLLALEEQETRALQGAASQRAISLKGATR